MAGAPGCWVGKSFFMAQPSLIRHAIDIAPGRVRDGHGGFAGRAMPDRRETMSHQG